jgi:hypothetical protein
MTTRIYRGSCHCGAVRFRFTSEPLTTGCRCTCSICRRKGCVMSSHYVAPEDFLLEGAEHLSCYRFGGSYRVNLGCVSDVDPLTLQVTVIDGAAF